MNREQIESLKVGDALQFTMDVAAFTGALKENARWQTPRRITRIHARGISVKGDAYICFYTEFGQNAEISGSISEGEANYRIVQEEIR